MKEARLVSLVVLLCVASATEDVYVPDGGLRMTDYILTRYPKTMNYKNKVPLMFVIDPKRDNHVSGGILNNGWETELNKLYKTLLDHQGPTKDEKSITLDVGANLGAFSMYVASLGEHLLSFEMQHAVFTLTELSRRVNNYYRMKLHHAALWDVDGKDVSYTTVEGNVGGTNARQDGSGVFKMKTKRLDSMVPQNANIFFMKIDVEGAEENVLRGFHSFMTSGQVRHVVMETRKTQAHIVEWLYDVGYACGSYDMVAVAKDVFVHTVATMRSDYMDIYCAWNGGGVVKQLAPRRSLLGTHNGTWK
jgi:FkbM family methyltransferase